jgi:rubredoxin
MHELLICPVCGYSFRNLDPKVQKGIIRCPMCGYEFKENKFPASPFEFDKKF